MIGRSLFYTNKYFAITFSGNKFAFPSPPALPATEKALLQQLVQNKKKDLGSKKKDILADKNLIAQLSEQAKVERQNAFKQYQDNLEQYKAKYTLPKAPKSPFIFYFSEKYVKDPNQKVTDTLKKLNQEFKQLPQEQQKVYQEKSAQDKQRYKEQTEIFTKQHQDSIVPSLRPLTSFQLYVKEQYEVNPNQKLSDVTSNWKKVSSEQKKVYEEKAEKIQLEQKQKIAEFSKQNNLSEEELKSLLKKPRSKSVEQKPSKTQQ